jgi:8-oxo-dGTP pyrophosphatase MutT (NUDIX family)
MIQQNYNMRVGANAVIIRDDAILLVEFGGAWRRHFNLPGGGIEPDEPIIAGLQREVREETCAEVEVGPLLLALEYFPPHFNKQYGPVHKLTLIFRCDLHTSSEPRLPVRPDPQQVAVRWVPLADLPNQPLLPAVAGQLLARLASPPAYNAFRDRV